MVIQALDIIQTIQDGASLQAKHLRFACQLVSICLVKCAQDRLPGRTLLVQVSLCLRQCGLLQCLVVISLVLSLLAALDIYHCTDHANQ